MSDPIETSSYFLGLRERAKTLLTAGIRGEPPRANTSDALAVLFKLASSPDTAVDAMALLHELQVHQVEVDLQHEELHRTRVELEYDLIRQTIRFERAPVPYLILDQASVLWEVNAAGSRLLRAASDELVGRPLTGFLSPLSGELLRRTLGCANTHEVLAPVELELIPVDGLNRRVWAYANRDASSGRFLVVLVEFPSSR